MKEQLIAVPAQGSAPVPLSASTFSESVEIQEDGSVAGSGLTVYFPDDNFTQGYDFPPAQQPIRIGAALVTGAPGRAPLLGKPARTVPVPNGLGTYTNVNEAATIYCKVVSMGAATSVRVIERP